jgi:hypothetical protein
MGATRRNALLDTLVLFPGLTKAALSAECRLSVGGEVFIMEAICQSIVPKDCARMPNSKQRLLAAGTCFGKA